MNETRKAIDCVFMISGFFKGDQHKTALWFSTPNPLLGGIKPWDMVELGRAGKLLKFIRTQLEENEPG